MRVIILLLFILIIACQSKKTTTEKTVVTNNEIIKIVNNSPKKNWKYPQKDSAQYLFYLNKRYFAKDLEKIKKKELSNLNTTLKAKYKIDFKTYSYQKYFNIAYRCTDAQRNHLEYVSYLFFKDTYQKYFRYEPKNPFQIVYFATKQEYTKHTGSSAYGFYQPSSKTLYTYTGSGEGTLWHELVHAFVDTNIEHDIQQWFSEGLASFYEMGGVHQNKFLEGYTNWRQPLLIKMLARKDYLPLEVFLQEDEMSEDDAYAKARFLFCYLWINNKMIPFVNNYLYDLSAKYKGKTLTKKTIELLEKLLKKSLEEIEKEYEVLAKKLPPYQKLTTK